MGIAIALTTVQLNPPYLATKHHTSVAIWLHIGSEWRTWRSRLDSWNESESKFTLSKCRVYTVMLKVGCVPLIQIACVIGLLCCSLRHFSLWLYTCGKVSETAKNCEGSEILKLYRAQKYIFILIYVFQLQPHLFLWNLSFIKRATNFPPTMQKQINTVKN